MDLSFTSGRDHVLSLSVPVGGAPQFALDGVRKPAAPRLVEFVYLEARYIGHDAVDDLTGLAKLLSVDIATIRSLAELVGAEGNTRFRSLEFEPVPLEEGELPESVVGPDGSALMQLVVETYTPAARYPLANHGGTTHTEVLLAFAVELAKFRSAHAPTLLIIEAADWGFFRDRFAAVADVIDACAKHCQILLVEPHRRLDPSDVAAREWVQYELILPPSPPRSPRVPAIIEHR